MHTITPEMIKGLHAQGLLEVQTLVSVTKRFAKKVVDEPIHCYPSWANGAKLTAKVGQYVVTTSTFDKGFPVSEVDYEAYDVMGYVEYPKIMIVMKFVQNDVVAPLSKITELLGLSGEVEVVTKEGTVSLTEEQQKDLYLSWKFYTDPIQIWPMPAEKVEDTNQYVKLPRTDMTRKEIKEFVLKLKKG